MQPDLALIGCRLPQAPESIQDVVVEGGRIVAVGRYDGSAREVVRLDGRLLFPGFVESHIHLDKSQLAHLCGPGCAGGLAAAVKAVAKAKQGFTVDDVYARAEKTLQASILHGVNLMRTHVEVDPRIGLSGLEAIKRLRTDYSWAVDLQICVFPQEGLTNDPGCQALLEQALDCGGQVLGGAPYTDSDPDQQLETLFGMARRFDVDLDLHLDFDLDPGASRLETVCRLTDAHGWGGRVTIGHVTSLARRPPKDQAAIATRLAGCGVALVCLPATDLYLTGEMAPIALARRAGVRCALSTNNVLNPFTPYGDGSLARIANLYANTVALGGADELADCFAMIGREAEAILRVEPRAIEAGQDATFVALDSSSPSDAVRRVAPAMLGYKRGRRTFTRSAPVLHAPEVGT